MSGIAGILNLNGAPVVPGRLGKMAAAMQYRGLDGTRVWHEESIGLAHCHFWTTPEDVGEAQPICSPNGQHWIVADARIDNREELMAALTAKGGCVYKKTPTDAELILAAYTCWGENCAQHLIGDFAFVIWDARKKRLFAARDVIGIRQLYYAVADESLYFGTTIGAVLAGLPSRPPLNVPLIESFVRGSVKPWVCQTVFDGLHRLPPAHALTVTGGTVQPPRLYHVLGSQPPPDCRSDREWIVAFRAVLDEAIRCRLRSTTPVGMAVSGGLDSSAMACAAYELCQQQPSLPQMRLYSTVFDETPTADEREYFDMVADHCVGVPNIRIPSDHLWALREFGADNGFPLDEPELFLLRSHSLAIFCGPAADGCRVVLHGDGADGMTGHNVYQNPSLLGSIGWRDWLAELPHYRQKGKTLLRDRVRPLIRGKAERWLQRWRAGRARSFLPDNNAHWETLPQDVCALADAYTAPPGLTPVGQALHDVVRKDFFVARRSALDVLAAYAGAEQRPPYLDRRLVEFMLHVPQHLLSWRGVQRVILRESMRGTLPEAVRTRTEKRNFGGLNRRGITQERRRIDDLLADSRAEALGFIDAGGLRQVIDDYRQSDHNSVHHFRKPLCLEAWLRANGY